MNDDIDPGFLLALETRVFHRTRRGQAEAALKSHRYPDRAVGLLRRFTGYTAFEFLLAHEENAAELLPDAWLLFQHGLIEPVEAPQSATSPGT